MKNSKCGVSGNIAKSTAKRYLLNANDVIKNAQIRRDSNQICFN